MDREFTGWIAPLSNRLSDGPRLYEDGLRLPFPPLSIALLFCVTGGSATWLAEAYLNYACVVLIPVLLFVAGRAFLSTSQAFLASIATLLVFLTLAKIDRLRWPRTTVRRDWSAHADVQTAERQGWRNCDL
jgi:hypothetical protein